MLGKLEGVDVFDMKPLQVDRLGTMKEPIKVYSLVSLGIHCYCTARFGALLVTGVKAAYRTDEVHKRQDREADRRKWDIGQGAGTGTMPDAQHVARRGLSSPERSLGSSAPIIMECAINLGSIG